MNTVLIYFYVLLFPLHLCAMIDKHKTDEYTRYSRATIHGTTHCYFYRTNKKIDCSYYYPFGDTQQISVERLSPENYDELKKEWKKQNKIPVIKKSLEIKKITEEKGHTYYVDLESGERISCHYINDGTINCTRTHFMYGLHCNSELIDTLPQEVYFILERKWRKQKSKKQQIKN